MLTPPSQIQTTILIVQTTHFKRAWIDSLNSLFVPVSVKMLLREKSRLLTQNLTNLCRVMAGIFSTSHRDFQTQKASSTDSIAETRRVCPNQACDNHC